MPMQFSGYIHKFAKYAYSDVNAKLPAKQMCLMIQQLPTHYFGKRLILISWLNQEINKWAFNIISHSELQTYGHSSV
jgi:hypothetical protein